MFSLYFFDEAIEVFVVLLFVNLGVVLFLMFCEVVFLCFLNLFVLYIWFDLVVLDFEGIVSDVEIESIDRTAKIVLVMCIVTLYDRSGIWFI